MMTESAQKSVARLERGFIHEVRKSLGHLDIGKTETTYWMQKVNNNVIDFLAQEVWLLDPGDPKV